MMYPPNAIFLFSGTPASLFTANPFLQPKNETGKNFSYPFQCAFAHVNFMSTGKRIYKTPSPIILVRSMPRRLLPVSFPGRLLRAPKYWHQDSFSISLDEFCLSSKAKARSVPNFFQLLARYKRLIGPKVYT